jgi:hypothetical protein
MTGTFDRGRRRSQIIGAAMAASMMLSACGSDEPSTQAITTATSPQSTSQPDSTSAPETGQPAQGNEQAPSLVVDTLDGGQLDVADLLGQDTVLWFWAPW